MFVSVVYVRIMHVDMRRGLMVMYMAVFRAWWLSEVVPVLMFSFVNMFMLVLYRFMRVGMDVVLA